MELEPGVASLANHGETAFVMAFLELALSDRDTSQVERRWVSFIRTGSKARSKNDACQPEAGPVLGTCDARTAAGRVRVLAETSGS
jgi:hypothetical protein